MNSYEFEARVAELKRRAHGRWTEILRSLGIDEKILNKRNQPCPLCGGTDRFQYTDKYGEGNYYCRGCGPGGGIKLLQGVQGWSFATVLRHIEQRVGDVKPIRRQSSDLSTDRMKKLAQRLWDEAKAITPGDEVHRYLSNRGLSLTNYPG